MKRLQRVLLLATLVLLGLLAWRVQRGRESASPATVPPPDLGLRQSVHDPDYTPHAAIPRDVTLNDSQDGVGWVFGRLIGVSDAPGTGSHAPYGGAPITGRRSTSK